jgi:serine/threonine protein kinase
MGQVPSNSNGDPTKTVGFLKNCDAEENNYKNPPVSPTLEHIRKHKKFGTEKPTYKLDLPRAEHAKNIVELNFEYKSKKSESDEGKRVEDYVLLKTIGKGNFGKVILAKSKIDNNFYALKCLKKSEITEMKCNHLIKAEKRVLEKIDHPFIIKLHLTFQTPEKLYMLFDYNNGGELFFHLQNKIRFSEDLAKFYAAQLYLALSYLHHNNIIYRDIKPENIILDNMGYIKLIDFGLAKDKFHVDSLTGTLCGTSEYLGNYLLILAPELILGNKYGFSLDWWGFGILLYEMLIGVPPFADDNRTRLFKKIVTDEPKFTYYSDRINVSNEARDLISKLLAKNPKDRIKPDKIPLHPFFKDISFDDIFKRKAVVPFVPKIVNFLITI